MNSKFRVVVFSLCAIPSFELSVFPMRNSKFRVIVFSLCAIPSFELSFFPYAQFQVPSYRFFPMRNSKFRVIVSVFLCAKTITPNFSLTHEVVLRMKIPNSKLRVPSYRLLFTKKDSSNFFPSQPKLLTYPGLSSFI